MESQKITISPKTKVGEMLDHYPQLEKVLIEMSPNFEKLRNPVLRKTVARVVTLQQIAAVGNLKVEHIVGCLRKEVGQNEGAYSIQDTGYLSLNIPDWFRESGIVTRFDASPLINAGGSPMNEILQQTHSLKSGEILELTTPFIPAPIIDMLISKGFSVYIMKMDGLVRSYFTRLNS